MKKIILILLMLVSLTGFSATYYVATTGVDTNPGTLASPWLTFQKAVNATIAGDSVIFRNGIYTTASAVLATIQSAGTLTNPIVFKSENKHLAKLNGQDNTTVQGIYIEYASFVIIEDFEFYGFQGGAIKIQSTSNNITLRGNKIHDIGKLCSDSGWGQVGISMVDCSNIIIEKNIIYNIGRFANGENGCTTINSFWQNHDHGIYIERNVDTLVISNNLIYDCKAGWGIHMYNTNGLTDTNISIINNTFADPNPNRDGHIVLSLAHLVGGVIANNIFYNPTTAAISVTTTAFTTTGLVVKNNITYGGTINSGTVTGITFAGNLDNTNPLLTNPAALDYTLTSASPAINAGVFVGLTTDYLGNPLRGMPDIGAYEFQLNSDGVLRYSKSGKVVVLNGKAIY